MGVKFRLLVFCAALGSLAACVLPGFGVAAALAAVPEGPLDVSDCVRLALGRNPSVLNARENVKESSGRALTALSSFVPSVSSRANYSRRIQGPQQYYISSFDLTLRTESVSSEDWSYNVSAYQSLLDLSQISEVQGARASVRATRHAFEATRQAIAYEVRLQFYEVLKAVKLAEVSMAAQELSRDELNRARALFEVGSVAKGDVLKAEVRLSQSTLELIAAENRVKLERSRLAKLMGLPVETEIEIAEDLGEESARVGTEGAIGLAKARRPDLLAARENLRAAEKSAFASKASRLPSLSGSVSYSWSDNSFPETGDDHRRNYAWDIGVGLELPIFDGFITIASIRQAKARAAIAENELRDTELQVALDVKEATLTIAEATERIKVSKSGLASAEEDYRLSREKYDLGSGTILELLDAQVNLSRARSSYVESLASLREAEALFGRATGEPIG
ncbi:MAG: TolC family protein [Candidatus Eisenbacteria bacterium]|nr:TolC family protein [Candidatus Eisenbacteria bacterium]